MPAWSAAFPFPFDAGLAWTLLQVGAGVYVVGCAVNARLSIAYALLWAPAAIFLPVPTAALLLLFGGRKHGALAAAKRRIKATAVRLSGRPSLGGNTFRLLGDRDGRATLATLQAEIRAARTRISISTYILSPDAVGRGLVALLAERARAGVEVRLLVDAVGSWGTPLRLCRQLRAAGGQVARFNPVLPMQGKGSANWRNHRKLAVFDGAIAVIGGQNLGLRYMGDAPSPRRFRDCSFRLEGPAAAALEQVFVADWCQATDTDPAELRDILRQAPPAVGEVDVAVIASGPDCEDDPLWEKLLELIAGARTELTLVTPYFVPDLGLFRGLLAAAARGCRVRLILPRRSDHRLVDFARRWYLRQLKEAGAEILFYRSGMLHAKLVVADGSRLVIGSANLDMRSLFLNYEIAAVVRDPAALRSVEDLIADLAAESTPFSEDLYRRGLTWTGRAVEAVSKALAPLL